MVEKYRTEENKRLLCLILYLHGPKLGAYLLQNINTTA